MFRNRIVGCSGWHKWVIMRLHHCDRAALNMGWRNVYRSPEVACRALSTLRSAEHEHMKAIRNIGIIAHIDAGKTTTSERMLYYSGFSRRLGSVDRGDTVMDYMEQERDRGITINSAAITFHWNHHKVNLIDTPGHVDFTIEVERALRVLDGSVAILDASAGVEAQTLTVWRQAASYKVPSIVYLNKMDKRGASVTQCLQSLQDKLRVSPLLLQLPLGVERDFSGVVDLIHFNTVCWNPAQSPDGKSFTTKPLTRSDGTELYEQALSARASLIGQLADCDEHIADLVLGEVKLEDISIKDLESAVRRVTLARKLVPVFCGSSLRNVGVQPLLDGIVSFLPSPKDIAYGFADYYGTDMCALAFKVSHDQQRGPLTYLRMYSGSLKSGATLYNINRQSTEKSSRILQVYADELHDVSMAVAGNIVAVAGLKQTFTGDTLTTSQTTAKRALKAWERDQRDKGSAVQSSGREDSEGEAEAVLPILAGMNVPVPVFFCSIEPPSLAFQKSLDHALQCLQKEDPSLKVEVNGDTGQTVLSGMGELHLDIVHSRIQKEYGIEADLGPLQIAYREAISLPADVTEVLDKSVGDQRHFVHLRMSVHPDPQVRQFRQVEVVPSPDNPIHYLRPPQLKALNNGVRSALANGPILGFPLIHVAVQLHEFQTRPGTSLAMVAACAVQCVTHAVRDAGPHLLEPMMRLEVSTDEDRLHRVLGDLSQRRSHVNAVSSRQDLKLVEAVTPLAELVGYSTDLRTITSGTATVSMELSHYQPMAVADQNQVIQSVTGFVPAS
ncbi:ribosome-releasing factor 2, mitochondrial-like [Babylonia areolata]|uniref:ribosome-releasing factor 2, mitochondrial-like n=1 Tax=Babylonia areolata TaxID=304850 RepID=UPI003FD21EB3